MKYFLKRDNTHKFYASVVNKSAIEEIIKLDKEGDDKYKNILAKDIIAFGETSRISHQLLSKFIDRKDMKHQLGNGQFTESVAYKCFASKGDPFSYGTTIYHEDKQSSWNCLMQVLGNPEYVLIYRERYGKEK